MAGSFGEDEEVEAAKPVKLIGAVTRMPTKIMTEAYAKHQCEREQCRDQRCHHGGQPDLDVAISGRGLTRMREAFRHLGRLAQVRSAKRLEIFTYTDAAYNSSLEPTGREAIDWSRKAPGARLVWRRCVAHTNWKQRHSA